MPKLPEHSGLGRPGVGVGIWIFHNDKILFSRRIGKHAHGTWALPGGHLEHGESFEDCARREAMEECGLEIHDIRLYTVTNDYFTENGKHYVTVHVVARSDSGTFKNREPEKHADFGWYAWENMPTPLMKPIENMLKQGVSPPADFMKRSKK
ncbi:MAG: NUDIX domain-containing protein [Rhodospirillales bacterium]|nr:NUDIX domain-containing protein [Rhodospirillales bacterium]